MESERKGYSMMAITQSRAYVLRKEKEPSVERSDDVVNGWETLSKRWVQSFFPDQKKRRGMDRVEMNGE